MATSMKKTTTTKTTTTKAASTVKAEKATIDKVAVEEVEEVSTEKKYEANDQIPCRSITTGLLLVEGKKTGVLYQWADYNDVEYVEYQDLVFMVRSRDKSLFYPRFIIEDEDFVAQTKGLEELYESLYEVSDLEAIIKLPINQMKKEIDKLPSGVQQAVKGLASTMIDRHQLDSVQKIKALDEIFGTQLLLALTQE